MLGDVVLVHGVGKPVAEGGDSATVVLPQCAGWYDLHTGAFSTPGRYPLKLTLDSIPAYYRAGAIVPLKNRVRRSSTCSWLDPLTLQVYLDPTTGTAKGHVYIDDYKTTTYQDGKSFLDVDLEFSEGALKASAVRGQLPAGLTDWAQVERVEIFGLKAPIKEANLMTKGAVHESHKRMEVPISRSLGGAQSLHSSVVKIKPWFDLRGEWKLTVQ